MSAYIHIVYACMYVCILWIDMYTCIYLHIHASLYVYVHIFMQADTRMCMCVHRYICRLIYIVYVFMHPHFLI